MDSLIICDRCGSDACYVDEVNQDIKTHFCYGCGFQTNSLMKEDSDFYNEQLETLPELYKDLMVKDDTGKIWMPSAINLPQQGMVFANGPSTDNWGWSAVKAVPVSEKEKTKYPIPGKLEKYYEWRMDMSTIKNYHERDFMEALTYIGVLPENDDQHSDNSL
tara:strand:- start:18726 stop:19211 length:486 start_codon:yes stop_codon:yes gene_type:complete